MTISNGLSYYKRLNERRVELISLRNENSAVTERPWGEKNFIKKEPVYDIKKIDKLINDISKEMRLLDEAIKKTNATIEIVGFAATDVLDKTIE